MRGSRPGHEDATLTTPLRATRNPGCSLASIRREMKARRGASPGAPRRKLVAFTSRGRLDLRSHARGRTRGRRARRLRVVLPRQAPPPSCSYANLHVLHVLHVLHDLHVLHVLRDLHALGAAPRAAPPAQVQRMRGRTPPARRTRERRRRALCRRGRMRPARQAHTPARTRARRPQGAHKPAPRPVARSRRFRN